MRFLACICLLFILLKASAQEVKRERESHLKRDQVPEVILKKLEHYLLDARKIRYIKETDGQKESIEVKFIRNSKNFSIEFDKEGLLEDIEVRTSYDSIESESKANIKQYLTQFRRNRIVKVQVQFSSTNSRDEDILKDGIEKLTGDVVRYEIIADLKKSSKWKRFELLFDENGNWISERIMIRRHTDFILY